MLTKNNVTIVHNNTYDNRTIVDHNYNNDNDTDDGKDGKDGNDIDDDNGDDIDDDDRAKQRRKVFLNRV